MKKITFLVLLSIMLVSASTVFAQQTMEAQAPKTAATEGAITVTPENFQDFAAANVGKEVELKGMVVHVCKHGGKKMFIIGEDPEQRVKIDASEKVSVFKPELEGSTVLVKGTIQPIVEEEVPEEEKATQDADHSNYYHKPQFSISCMTLSTVEE
jgi:hypothetical protein